MIKVSVIVYVKDTVEYISECLNSISNQSLREIEIIVVDGGSTDGTLEIIKSLQEKDSRINLLYKKGSVGAQFNQALEIAQGEYVGVCEADDYVIPDMYQQEYEAAVKDDLDVVRAAYYQFFRFNEQEYRYYTPSCFGPIPKNKVIKNNDMMFLKQHINGFWNGIYKREMLLDKGIVMNETQGASFQDISFSFLTQLYAKNVIFLDKPYYCYRIDNPGASVNTSNGVEKCIREYRLLKDKLINYELWDSYNEIYKEWEIASLQWYMSQLDNDRINGGIEASIKMLMDEWGEDGFEELRFRNEIIEDGRNNRILGEYMQNEFCYEQNFILFGLGNIGGVVYDFLIECHKNILLCDNDATYQNNGYRSKSVSSPEEAVKMFPQAKILIANGEHYEEMKNQLIGLGVSDDRIVICSDRDFFLRHIFANTNHFLKNAM